MADQPPAGLLEVGRCGKPHGVRGRVSVHLSSDRRERLEPGARLWCGQWLDVHSSAQVPGSDRWIVAFDGVDDRSAAEELVNRTLWAEPLEVDEALWVHQIIGARVCDMAGTLHGRCVSVIANPANDLLELDSGALVPVTFVVNVTSDNGMDFTVVVDPPAGLFELFEDVQGREDPKRDHVG